MKEDRLRVWIDGACEPINPGGTATYGIVVKHDKEVLFEKGAVVSSGRTMSNNVAEYSGLIAFLEWYIEAKPSLAGRELKRRPAIYSDSRLLICQMTGEWRVKKGLYVPYYQKARSLIQEHQLDLGFWQIPREQNEEADKLSKKALLDAGIKLRIQPGSESPPPPPVNELGIRDLQELVGRKVVEVSTLTGSRFEGDPEWFCLTFDDGTELYGHRDQFEEDDSVRSTLK